MIICIVYSLDRVNRHVFMEIIEDRHGKKATIIASQFHPEWMTQFKKTFHLWLNYKLYFCGFICSVIGINHIEISTSLLQIISSKQAKSI